MSTAIAERSNSSGGSWLLFALLCLVWGSTWLALKIGVSTVPPLLFAALRFLAAAALMLAPAAASGRLRIPLGSVIPGAVLMVAANYGLMAWGMTRVPSDVAAVINLSVVPMATLALGIADGRDRCSAARAGALMAGIGGLALLLGPNFGNVGAAGMAAIAAGAGCYAWGAIVTQKRLTADPICLAGWQCLLGGGLLAVAAQMTEPCGAAVRRLLQAPDALGSLIFLVATSVIGGTVYLMLLARWAAGRVAAYAYVCPLIALAEGAAIRGHLPRARELAAIVLLLIAARLSLTVPAFGGDSG